MVEISPLSRGIAVAAGFALALLLPCATPASAQSTDDDSAFDFSLPGARSRGIGGAFVAIADDATSVYSNPAGLTSLFRPEVSAEFRHWSLTSVAIDRGHAFGEPRNIGIDVERGIRDRAFRSSVNGAAFLSFAYPRTNWAIGVFRHQLARYRMSRETQGIFFDCQGNRAAPPYCEQQDGVQRLFPARQFFDLSIRGSGVTFAFRPSQAPRLRVGASLQYFEFDLDATREVFNARDDARGSLRFAAPEYSAANRELIGRRRGDDVALAVNAGLLFDVTQQWTIGGTFRQGPRFTYAADTTTGAGSPNPPNITYVNLPASPFKVPDTFALGFAYRPNNALRFGFEYDRVMYSQLIEQTVDTAHPEGTAEGLTVLNRLVLDNGNQFRIGGEYSMIVGAALISLRGGAWSDPLHRPYLRVDDPATGFPAPGWSLLLPKRKGEVHFSAGAGIAASQRLQFDIAVDRAPSVTTFSASAIVRF